MFGFPVSSLRRMAATGSEVPLPLADAATVFGTRRVALARGGSSKGLRFATSCGASLPCWTAMPPVAAAPPAVSAVTAARGLAGSVNAPVSECTAVPARFGVEFLPGDAGCGAAAACEESGFSTIVCEPDTGGSPDRFFVSNCRLPARCRCSGDNVHMNTRYSTWSKSPLKRCQDKFKCTSASAMSGFTLALLLAKCTSIDGGGTGF
mmetsp:Transcript_121943/g.211617  ORF Transcript_121943/g.211617 Transcript_121943/m.211617 type:complete len:207 (+) Transcript_121943:522-1142(+)